MGAAVLFLGNIELDRWYADIYGAVSLAFRLSSLVKDRAATVKLAYHIRRLDSVLSNFFVEIHKAIEKDVKRPRSDS